MTLMAARIAAVLATLAYPALVWAALRENMPLAAACTVAAAALIGALVKKSALSYACAALGTALAAASFLTESSTVVKFYPVTVNVALLTLFALSLVNGTPMIERLARLREPQLDIAGVRYCRLATIAWCVFFIINGLISLDSALWRSNDWWALYNGLLAYVLIAAMFAAEWIVRQIYRKRLPGPRHDP